MDLLRHHTGPIRGSLALTRARREAIALLEQAAEVRAAPETPREADLGGQAACIGFMRERRMAAFEAVIPDLAFQADSVVLEHAQYAMNSRGITDPSCR